MFDRIRLGSLMFICLALPFAGCGSSTEVDSLAVSPTTLSFAAAGLSAQLIATATIGHGSHPSTTENVTDLVTWTTGSADVATVSPSGLVTSVGPGSIQVTATINGFTGLITAYSQVTVTTASTGPTNTDVTSISIIPGTQAVAAPKDTAQFVAIGTTASGSTENITNSVAWTSSSAQIATITNTGLATGVGKGTATITAIVTNLDKSVATGTANFTVSGGTSEAVTALTIIPGNESLSASAGQGQLIAIGTSGTTGLTVNDTNLTTPTATSGGYITWSSSAPAIATVCNNGLPVATPQICNASNSGLVVGVSPGVSTITAQWNNTDGSVVVSTASVTITATSAPEPLLSLTIIPSAITVDNLQGTGNFLAIGTFATVPYVRDLTNTVTWLSSSPQVFPVSSDSSAPNAGAPGGIVTAYGSGNATIIAEATSSDGTIQTATATFNCPLVAPTGPDTGSCYPGSQAYGLLVTLTVYNEGVDTTNWLVTAPSATGTKNVLHCGPGWAVEGNTTGSVCTATYPAGTTVTLTASQPTGVTGTFGGWSYNCTPNPNPPTAAGPNTCTITLGDLSNPPDNSNVTVGAIFN